MSEVDAPMRVEAANDPPSESDEVSGGNDRRLPDRSTVLGLCVCGGRSVRMGTDKALVALGGASLIDRSIAALESVAGRVTLACGPRERYRELGRELVLDAPGLDGPLAGLHAGLESAGPGVAWVVTLSCDLSRIEGGVLEALLRRAASDDLDACLLETERGSQPLVAVYHVRVAPAVQCVLERGDRRMVAFHDERIDGRALRIGTLSAGELPAPLRSAAYNVNTKSELRQERERERERPSS